LPKEISNSSFKILIPFGNNEKGKSLLRLANSFVKNQKENCNVTGLHLSLSDEVHAYNLEEYEKETFEPIMERIRNFKSRDNNDIQSNHVDIETDIADIAVSR
jgi:hypothetical protein